jgi:hypothetical protein
MMIRVFLLSLIILCFGLQSKAIVTNWTGQATGGNGTNWYNSSNWSNGVPGINDDVQIGISGTYTNSPVINASTTVKSLTFGILSSGSLTINSGITLTVTNDITIKYSSSSATISILGQTVSGVLGGTLTCGGTVYVGDNTAPITPAQNGTINATYVVTVEVAIQRFNINGSLILNTTSSSATVPNVGYSSNVNNPVFNLNNGYISVAQNVQTTNSAYVNTALSGYTTATNTARLITNPVSNNIAGSSSTLAFGGSVSIATAGFVDFYGGGVGSSTVNYNGTAGQTICTSSTVGLGVSPANYQNLIISGTGAKTIQNGTMTITGTWNSSGGKIDAVTNSSTINLTGAAQTLTDAGSNNGLGVAFANVIVGGSGTKTISSGKFSIASTGVLTMTGTTTLATGGNLTLMSDAAGSATVAALPLGTAITGNVKVQRFFKGSSADLSKRGYRLISSAVYTASPGSVKCFDLRYLLDSAYVSGAVGGGFNAPTSNPSLYLYREDIVSSNTGFTAGNWKGIAKINNTNAYDIGTQKRLTTLNVADTTINLPVGNGVLFFFRGNLSNNATQSGSKVGAPYDFPEDVSFLQTGVLNTGTINVKPWFTSGALSYTNSPSLNNAVSRGFAAVGNPYASTINFEKFNRNGTNSSIYGGGFPAASVTPGKIWIYNATTKQYDTYLQTTTISSVADTTTTINPTGSIHTGDASNMIASGQGFLIKASATGQTLSFRETAKTTTQPVAANVIRVMSAPASASMFSFASAAADIVPSRQTSVLNFKLIKDSINVDEVALAFNDHTGNNFSQTDDVEDLNGNAPQVSLSLITSDDVAASIKQLTLPQTGKQVIALLADATTSGRYQLKLNQIANLPAAYEVWLLDNFTRDSLDIKNSNTYNFNIDKSNPATFGRNRFKIVVKQNPAKLMHDLSFNALKTTLGAQVVWKTENENNDYVFYVQKSTDNGKTFNQIGTVNSSGVSTYNFLDPNPAQGKNQYRVKLKHLLFNDLSYSSVATLMYADTVASPVRSISVYPNPATNIVNIKMLTTTGDSNGTYLIKISSSSGRIIKQFNSSQPYWQESITGLLPGTYIVQVVNFKENKIQGETKFVKL